VKIHFKVALIISIFAGIFSVFGFSANAQTKKAASNPYYTVSNKTVYLSAPNADEKNGDTKKIQAAITYAGKKGYKLCFAKKKTYLITAAKNNQNILTVSYKNLDIDLNGSTIKLAATSFPSYNMIYIKNVRGVKIHNGQLQGDRLKHTYVKNISAVSITNGGKGYLAGNLIVDNTNTEGKGFAGIYSVKNGVITSIQITNPGTGYKKAPVISATGGYGAVLTPLIETDGFGYGIHIYGSSAEIKYMEIYDMTGDGIITEESSIKGVGSVSNIANKGTVTGTGTSFNKVFQKGDPIKIGTQTGAKKEARNATVTAVSDDSHLKTTSLSDAYSNVAYYYFTKSKIVLSDCNIHHCRRQGITVLDINEIYINNCHIHHIGTWDDVSGASPQSGIDCEPDWGTKQIRYLEITNSIIDNCTNFGIVGGKETLKAKIQNLRTTTRCCFAFSDLYISNSEFNYNENKGTNHNRFTCTEAYNCTFSSSIKNEVIYLNGKFINCSFVGSDSFDGNSTKLDGNYIFDSCEVTNIRGVTVNNGSDSRKSIVLAGIFVKYGNANPVFINNTFKNCSFNIVKNNYIIYDNNKFNDCKIVVEDGVTLTCANCSFFNCNTANNYRSKVYLMKCFLTGTNIFGNAAKTITNSTIELSDIRDDKIFNCTDNIVNSVINNSTLKIKSKVVDMNFLPEAYNCVFYLNPLNMADILPDKCINCSLFMEV